MIERRISTEVKNKLVEVLLRFDTMSDRDDRNLCISELEDQLGHSLGFRRHADAKKDVWALVTACLKYPNALMALEQVLSSFHGNSNSMADLRFLVGKIGKIRVADDAGRGPRSSLIQALPGGTSALAASVYSAWLPEAEPWSSEAESWSSEAGALAVDVPDAETAIAYAEAVSAASDDPLVPLRFAERLAHSSATHVGRELHQWMNALGVHRGIEPAVLRRLCTEARQAISVGVVGDGREAPLGASEPVVVPDAEADQAEGEGETMQTVIVSSHPSPPKPADLPRIWGNVPFRNPTFTGRGEHLRALQRELGEHEQATVLPDLAIQPQTLHGLGGVGKTQLAIEYIYRHGDKYNLVWWISAERPTDVLTSLAELGERLGIRQGQDRQQSARSVLDELATTEYRWLLIYDNANDPDEIGPLVPSANRQVLGHVIITSRNADWTRRWHAIEVDVFERVESIELLQKRGTHMAEEIANILAEKLGDLPLALEQAANFQVATGMPTSEYLKLFDQRVRDLLDEGKPADYPTTVAAFLTLAFDNLRAASPPAAELLDLFAFLGPDPIAATLLHSGRRAELTPLLARSLRDNLQMNRMIRELPRYGLAKVVQGQRIQVHRLVQSVLRAELRAERAQRTRQNVQNLLATASPSHPDVRENNRIHAELGPHIIPAELVDSENGDARLVAIDQARYLFVIGDYPASRDLAQRMVTAWSTPPEQGGLGRGHEQTILAMRHLANALRMLGDYQEARRLAEEAFHLLLENPEFGEDHEHTVHVAFGLGFDLSMAGDLEGALRSSEENLRRAIRVYGPDDDYTLQATGNVAMAQRTLGHFREAHEMSEDIVHKYEESLGLADARTLLHVMYLSCDLYGLGDYREALRTQRRVWDRSKEILEEHQRERLLSDRNIAIGLRKTGEHRAALDIAEANHKAFEQYFGHSHEYTLAAGMTRANALRAVGRLPEARSVASAAVERYEAIFGERHHLTLAARVNLGIVLRLLGERRTAHEKEEQTYQALVSTLGDEHPYTLSAASNYANSLLQLHRVAEARELRDQVFERSRRVRGEEHPDTLACAVNVALDLQDMARVDSVVDVLAQVLGPEHPDTVDAIRGIRADCDIEVPPT